MTGPRGARGADHATRPLPRLSTRTDVQGLRGVAVGLVILDHVGLRWFSGGYVGVDVFFVVSGFLISSLLLREATTTGRVRVGAFYARRARRILPAATVTLVVTAVVSALVLPIARASQVAQDVAWSAAFLANVHFGRLGTDYFTSDRPPSPAQHFWSLAVEEQFYLVWPVLVALVAWVARRQARSEDASLERVRRTLPAVALVVLGVWAASLAWSIVLTQREPTAAYFSTPARVWELATGVLLALAAGRIAELRSGPRSVLCAVGLLAIAGAAVGFTDATPFPGWRALVPVLGTAAVLAAGATGPVPGVGWVLTLRPLTWVGDISYSLYLWHWPVLLLGRRLLGLDPRAESIVLVLMSLGLATASYHLVEAPFRHRVWWRPVGRALALWPAALALVAVGVGFVHLHTDRVLRARIQAARDFDPDSVPPGLRTPRNGERVHDAIAESLDMAAVEAPVPFPLRNDLTRLDEDRPKYRRDCAAERAEVSHELCPLGDVGSVTRIVVIGDSHAYMWLPAFDQLGQEAGVEVVPLIKYGCAPYDLDQRSEPGGPEFTACEQFRSWAGEQIAELAPSRVIAAARAYPDGLLLGEAGPRVWSSAVGRWATDISGLGPDVTLLGDVASLGEDPARCLDARDHTMADCTTSVGRHLLAVNRALENGAALGHATYVNVNDLVCVDGRCPMVVDHIVTFHDGQHLSATWVLAVADELGTLVGFGPHPS